MINPHRFSIGPADAQIAMLQWGESVRPPALLLHGTGFVADVWDEVARELASTYTVYALDRRGHGASHKPGAYHFLDYADDVCRVIDALDLRDVYGIGHSAGATDLLLTAKMRPGCFTRLFVMEPTVMDPRTARSADLSEESLARVQGTLRRRAEFDSADAVFARYSEAPAFADWTETSLWAYVRHGFKRLDDGRVRLCCTPEIESAILRPIYEAMEQVYVGDARGNPFAWLTEIDCPVRVTTAANSGSIYKEMARRAVSLIPIVSTLAFEDAGHCVAQELPSAVVRAVREFAK
ncbi:pimeloyl-ACP methyl ester carboxylesterase [Bradyrhizobium sp. R2.2-H]|jgi:pimeloyl-ACP methyl ester carboxylesterase|uniref:alpha/beta fold hydrolase n=1 Tax=unclassified Bradyrhizobium TaxID=2631580 RepID=UPI00105375FF|nr:MULTISPECIES: alpha/beta hydrolase [unclassified Bradyrhizobium]TCU79019.1 pimeloyl-ACP methyl ester carboxylesterase [Bradyrhizobium sp. Y-H1]TCU81102.1 pimeloyl-ACP methyl ester carboxylesterase [Bradyrhizobium sp. R2.2-H]